MKSLLLNFALLAVIGTSALSCKDKNKEIETEAGEEAMATEMATEYKVDTAESEIMWEGSKPTGSHHGTINLSSGTISVNNGTVEAGNFVIDMTSINDEDLEGDQKANLEAHLKGTVEGKEGDFFNTTKYPTATFVLTGIEKGEGKDLIKGNLTIKDKTNHVEFPATTKMEGNQLMLMSDAFTIDRTKWDVNYGSKTVFANLGDKFISDEMKITVAIVANKE